MHEQPTSLDTANQTVVAFPFLLFRILLIVQSLHSYEYADGNPLLDFLVT